MKSTDLLELPYPQNDTNMFAEFMFSFVTQILCHILD